MVYLSTDYGYSSNQDLCPATYFQGTERLKMGFAGYHCRNHNHHVVKLSLHMPDIISNL